VRAFTSYRTKPITIKAMAEIIGIHPYYLSAQLRGKKPMSNRVANQMEHLLKAMHSTPAPVIKDIKYDSPTLTEDTTSIVEGDLSERFVGLMREVLNKLSAGTK